MCVGCVMCAASAATGSRTWLQNRNFGWLTPRRLRRLTIGVMCAAGLFSSLSFSGSTPTAVHGAPAVHAAAR
jgi:hypothetical protein